MHARGLFPILRVVLKFLKRARQLRIPMELKIAAAPRNAEALRVVVTVCEGEVFDINNGQLDKYGDDGLVPA